MGAGIGLDFWSRLEVETANKRLWSWSSYIFQAVMGLVLLNTSGVAGIWCEEGHEAKRKEFKLDTRRYYEINAINNDKAIDLNTFPG